MTATQRMVRWSPLLGWGLLLCAAGLLAGCDAEETAEYADPKRFEEDIRAFEAEDARASPAPGQTLFVGSSSIRMWHDALQEHMAPLPVLGRGFGGSNMRDLNHYADRIVFPYQPSAIVLYEGDNDIASGISPQRFFDEFRGFVDRVREELPEATLYFLSIKPSRARWELWPVMQAANELVRSFAAENDRVEYIDVATPLLDEGGEPDASFFVDDELHLSPAGYRKWRDEVRAILLGEQRASGEG